MVITMKIEISRAEPSSALSSAVTRVPQRAGDTSNESSKGFSDLFTRI